MMGRPEDANLTVASSHPPGRSPRGADRVCRVCDAGRRLVLSERGHTAGPAGPPGRGGAVRRSAWRFGAARSGGRASEGAVEPAELQDALHGRGRGTQHRTSAGGEGRLGAPDQEGERGGTDEGHRAGVDDVDDHRISALVVLEPFRDRGVELAAQAQHSLVAFAVDRDGSGKRPDALGVRVHLRLLARRRHRRDGCLGTAGSAPTRARDGTRRPGTGPVRWSSTFPRPARPRWPSGTTRGAASTAGPARWAGPAAAVRAGAAPPPAVDAAMSEVILNCSLVVIALAVVPWRYVWQRYVMAKGDRWR